MRSKEKVLKPVSGEKPDRIPIDLGSTNCTTIAIRAFNLSGKQKLTTQYRKEENLSTE